MSVAKRMIAALDATRQQIWDDSLDDPAFETLRRKALMLTAQIAVHQILQQTARRLLGSQSSLGLLNAPSRLGKLIDVVYGKPDIERNEARWQKLRDMDCECFLLIAVSYTPLEITKMSRTEFDYLVGMVSEILNVKNSPPRWIFRKEIRLAIAGKADLQKSVSFRKKYHTLEFNSETSRKGQSAQRDCLEHQSPYGPETDNQSDVSEAQAEMPDDCSSLVTSAETGAGVILASIKEGMGHGEDGSHTASSSMQPRKRRHIEQRKQQKPVAANSPSPHGDRREMEYMYTNAPASIISIIAEPFRAAVENSRLWKWE